MKKFLVIDPLGFVGFALIECLLAEGHEVYGIEIMKEEEMPTQKKVKALEIGRHVNLHILYDGLNKENLDQVPNNIDLVYYCMLPQSIDNQIWPVSSEKLINENIGLCKQRSADFIYISSLEVFGDYKGKINEDTPVAPVSVIGYQNYREEKYLSEECENQNVKYLIMRLPMLYGPWIEEDIFNTTRNQDPFDLLYIHDAARGLYKAGCSDLRNEIVHLGTGKKNQWAKAKEIMKGKKIQKPVTQRYVSIVKAKKLLGFEASTSLKEGIKKQEDFMKYIKKLKDKGLFDIV